MADHLDQEDFLNTDFHNLRTAVRSAQMTFKIRARANNNTPAVATAGRPRRKEDVTKQEALGNVRHALQRVNQSPLRPTKSYDLDHLSGDTLDYMRDLHLTVLRMKQKTEPLGDKDWEQFQTGLKLLSGTMEMDEPGSKVAGTQKLDFEAVQRDAQQWKDSREDKKNKMKARKEKQKLAALAAQEAMKERSASLRSRHNPVINYGLADPELDKLLGLGSDEEDGLEDGHEDGAYGK